MNFLIRLLCCLLLFTFVLGCAEWPISSRIPEWRKHGLIESLDKQEVEQVFKKLGKPAQHLQQDNKQFLIYADYSASRYAGFIFFMPYTGTVEQGYLNCLKIEINPQGFVEHVEEKHENSSKALSVSKDTMSLMCMGLFWDVGELGRILSASQYSPAQLLEFFHHTKKLHPSIAVQMLCLSADQGYKRANRSMGAIHEMGYHHSSIRIFSDYKKAYVRYAQSDMDEQELQRFIDNKLSQLNTENYLKALQALEEWKPGQCAAELGLITTDNESERNKVVRQEEEQGQQMEYFLQQAKQGNADAQLALFKGLRRIQPEVALAWICKSADLGNHEARLILGNMFQHGGYSWIEEGFVERNYKLAYVWYALSGEYDQKDLKIFADRDITPKIQVEAKKALEDWQPGNCERELGLDGDELININ